MILPFKGILYNNDKIKTLADVVTPPYDVIQPEMQTELMEKSPYNFCWVDLPKETGDERYQKAKAVFQKWCEDDVLQTDSKPAIYLHRHTFYLPDGKKVARKGFFAACQAEDFSKGKILPHEKTLEGPKRDRLEITKATTANLSPVFSLYSDSQKTLENLYADILKTTPAFDFMSDTQERHEVWKIQDEDLLKKMNDHLNNQSFFIADGHHRYETALNYKNEILEKHPDLSKKSAARFLLMYFSNLNDEGLVVLPIHRALHSLENFSLESFLQNLSQIFEIKEFEKENLNTYQNKQKSLSESHHAFLIMPKNNSKGYLASLTHQKWQEVSKDFEIHDALAPLDVTVLHHYIFQNLLKISEQDQAEQKNIVYAKSEAKALEEIESEKCDLVFLLNATKIEQMQNVATAGLKMPQKSTYFYPKIISGLVMHSVNPLQEDGLNQE